MAGEKADFSLRIRAQSYGTAKVWYSAKVGTEKVWYVHRFFSFLCYTLLLANAFEIKNEDNLKLESLCNKLKVLNTHIFST